MNTVSFVLMVSNEEPAYFLQASQCIKLSMFENDEFIIIIDDEHYNNQLNYILENKQFILQNNIYLFHHNLNNNFAEHRNFALSKCKCDYIFMLDCDEYVSFIEMRALHTLDSKINAAKIPRINKVLGLTNKELNENDAILNNIIKYPDFQTRFIKNKIGIFLLENVMKK
jgi:glycosyltransferase involved in cell wall biosynthesis